MSPSFKTPNSETHKKERASLYFDQTQESVFSISLHVRLFCWLKLFMFNLISVPFLVLWRLLFANLLICLFSTPRCVNNAFKDTRTLSHPTVGVFLIIHVEGWLGVTGCFVCFNSFWVIFPPLLLSETSHPSSSKEPSLLPSQSPLSLKADDWWWLLSPEVCTDRGE